MERSYFLYIPLIQIIIIKRIQLPIPCIHERAFFIFFLSRITQTPSSTYLQYKTTMSSICFCRETLLIVQTKKKKHAIPKINLYVWKVNLNYMYTSAEGKELCITTSRFCPPPFFFFACQNFRKVGPPPLTKIPGSAPEECSQEAYIYVSLLCCCFIVGHNILKISNILG